MAVTMSQDSREKDVFQRLQKHLKEVEPALDVATIAPNASLSGELGLDSLRLASLFDRIRQEHAGVNLLPWFMSASQRGGDSLESLAVFLLKATERQVST